MSHRNDDRQTMYIESICQFESYIKYDPSLFTKQLLEKGRKSK